SVPRVYPGENFRMHRRPFFIQVPAHPDHRMNPSLQFRLSQHLTLTPQLQQSIRLLQLSTVELNQEIERLLMENPALEREDIDEGETQAAPVASGPSEAGADASAEAPPASDADWPVDVSNWRGTEGDEENEKSFTPP